MRHTCPGEERQVLKIQLNKSARRDLRVEGNATYHPKKHEGKSCHGTGIAGKGKGKKTSQPRNIPALLSN